MFWFAVSAIPLLLALLISRVLSTAPTFPFAGSTINSTLPNTITLKFTGHREECLSDAGSAGIYPGMLLQKATDGGMNPHAVYGGIAPTIVFAIEDPLQGHSILDPYNNGDQVFVGYPKSGDNINAIINAGVKISAGQPVMSMGDGTVGPTPAAGSSGGSLLYTNVADSAAVVSTATETIFNKNWTAPANFFQVGDIIKVRGLVSGVGVTATPTLTTKLKLVNGAGSPVTITAINTGALSVIAADLVEFEMTFVVRTIGATGTIVGTGSYTSTISGTTTPVVANLASTTFDTTQTWEFEATAQWSASSASNTCLLRVFEVEINRTMSVIGEGEITTDNSAGSTFVWAPIKIR